MSCGLNILYSTTSVPVWRDDTQPEQIEKWREEVRKLAKDSSTGFRLYFPADNEEWRTVHVVTWLAGCAPGLDSADLVYLKQQKITGSRFGDFIPESKPPTKFAFSELTEATYQTVRQKLQENNLIPAGIFAMLACNRCAACSLFIVFLLQEELPAL